MTSWYPTARHETEGVFIKRQIDSTAGSTRSRVVVFRAGPFRPWRTEPTGNGDGLEIEVGRRVPIRAVGAVLAVLLHRGRLRAPEPAAVHAHLFSSLPPAWLLSRLLRRPLVYTEHSSRMIRHNPARLGGSERRLFGWLARRARHVTAVSEYLAEEMQITLRLSSIPTVVPNIVDLDVFTHTPPPLRPSRPLVVTVSNLAPLKRWDLVLDMAERLRDLDPEVVLVGDGDEIAAFRAAIVERDLSDIVEHRPALSPHDLAALLSAASCYVQSSDIETFSVAIAEALAVGCPVVSTRSGGPESAFPDAPIEFVPVDDPARLADAVRRIVDAPRRSDPRPATVDCYTNERVGGLLSDLYRGLLP